MQTLIVFLALLGVALCQTGIFAGAYNTAQCTTPFSASLRPGVLPSAVCVNVNGTYLQVNDDGNNVDARFVCTQPAGCTSCIITADNVPYGVCTAIAGGMAHGLFYKVIEGTSLQIQVWNEANCPGATPTRGTETFVSTSFPTACGPFTSTVLEGYVNVQDLGSKAAISTGCQSSPPCGNCTNVVLADYNTCTMVKAGGLGANRYVRISKAPATTNSQSTAPTTTRPTSPAAFITFSMFAALIAAIALLF